MVTESEQASILPPQLTSREGLPLNFRNPVAVRIALIVGAGSALVSLILPLLNIFTGFAAVFLYVRRTGLSLNAGSGAKMGWITALLAFPLYAILFVALQFPRLSEVISTATLERVRTMSGQDPALTQQMIDFIRSGPGMAMLVAIYLVGMFVLMTLLSMAGGALGAKMAGGR